MRAAEDISQKKNIYERPYLETGIDYYKYSPAFAILLIPLSKLHKHISVPIWYFFTFVFFMGAIFFTQKILTANAKHKILSKTFYFLAILISLRFLLSVIQRVQSDCLVLFLLSLFMLALFLKRDVLAGLSLASAAMVKLTPLIFIPYLLWKRRFKAAGACGVFILFYLFSPALYLGNSLNLEYLRSWLLVHQKNPPQYILWYKNQSLLSCLLRFFTPDSEVNIFSLNPGLVFTIFAILAGVLFCLVFVFTRARKQNPSGFSQLGEFSLVLICMILFSPLAWKHTFVQLVIPHLVLLYYLIYLNPQDKVTRVLLIISFFLNTVLNPELTKPFARTVQLYSSITFGTVILYAALLRVSFKRCEH
ncbi:MAG: DUF2029 domain-containing protein [Omnitrophica bacterium]|nr:DUF2029 domain-containing protein [Candidatus Omnitrophota bacterium]